LKKTAIFAAILAALAAGLYLRRDNPPAGTDVSDASDGPGSPAAGGRLTVAYRSEPKTFNRLVSPQLAEELVARLQSQRKEEA